jgi:Abortive infection alpha/Protein of unknown function (DUF2806)
MIDPVTGKVIVDALKTPAVKKVVASFCDTFPQFIEPSLDGRAAGTRIAIAGYERMNSDQRRNVDETAILAMKQIEGREIPRDSDFDPKVVASALAGASMETDDELRELWAKLLARELTTGGVHPMIPGILAELNSRDAQMLVRIAERSSEARRPGRDLVIDASDSSDRKPSGDESLSEAALAAQGLIAWGQVSYDLTPIGKAFVEAVGGPTLAAKKPSPEPPPTVQD